MNIEDLYADIEELRHGGVETGDKLWLYYLEALTRKYENASRSTAKQFQTALNHRFPDRANINIV